MSKHKATQFQLEGEARFQVREGRVELPVRVDGVEQVVYFATQDCALRPSDEALVSTSLLPCMVAGCDYPRQLELDPQFIGALPLIQDMYRMWMPQLRMVEIPAQATPAAPATERGTKVGAFFSGGVDSFYTLLKHQEEITHVCFVHGMDILLDNVDFRFEVARRIRGMARDFGKQVIEIETNSRSILDSYITWLIGYGSILRTIPMLLEGFAKFYIPGGHYAGCMCPDGVHPLLDPLWNTHRLTLVHDACDVTRFRKCEFVSRHPITYDQLRVCQINLPGQYNCCRCEKCFRTMIYLAALDRLDKFPVFPKPLDLTIKYTKWQPPLVLHDFYAPVYYYLLDQGTHPELQAYLRQLLFPSLWKRCYGQYRQLRKAVKTNMQEFFDNSPHVH